MKTKLLAVALSCALTLAAVPVYAAGAFASTTATSNYNVLITPADAGKATFKGSNAAYAGQTVTLRVVDAYSRNTLVSEAKVQANGDFTFGTYTFANGSYTAFVGGVAAPESQEFTIGSVMPAKNADLKSLKFDQAELVFDKAKTSYELFVGSAVSNLTITAEADDANANVKINGKEGTTKTFALEEGKESFAEVLVTAQDGVTTKTYTLRITRAKAQEATADKPVEITDKPVTITVPAGVNATVKVATSAPSEGKVQATLPLVDVQASTSIGNISVGIPSGTVITAPEGWDGVIKLPEVLEKNSVSTSDGNIESVIEVGSTQFSLSFSKAIRLVIPGQASKSAGYVRNGVFTPITGTVSSDSQAAADQEIVDGKDAKTTHDNDLVIWTKHFTKFASYTPVTPPSDTTTPSTNTSGGVAVPSNSRTVSATEDADFTLNNVKLAIPAGATSKSIQVTVDKVTDTAALPVDNVLQLLGDVYEVKKDSEGDFSKPITLALPFDKSKVDLVKKTVAVYWLNEKTKAWVQLENTKVDTVTGVVSGTVTHFTKFAVLASDLPANAAPVVDLTDIKGHWAESNIMDLVKLGAINGYEDMTFKPNNNITRAEFVTILMKALKLASTNGSQTFADTKSHWAKDSIGAAAGLGIVGGFQDNTFRPDQAITREQMAAIVVRAAKITGSGKNVTFKDSQYVSEWAVEAVATAADKGLLNGYEDGTVRPQANTTRAEATTVILRAIALSK